MNADYKSLSDDELISLFRKGDRQAAEYLMERHKDVVKMKAASLYLIGGDKEDLLQEGMIGLFRALNEYDPEKDASLSTFCNLVVTRHLYNAIRNMKRQKHLPLNNFISIYDSSENPDEGEEIAELPDYDGDPETLLIEGENIERIERIIETELSPLEREVLELRLVGMKNKEISRIINKDEKSIDNALTRLRSKLGKKIPR